MNIKKIVFSLASCHSISNCFILHSFNTKYKLNFITHFASFYKTVVIFQLNSSICKVLLLLQATALIRRGHFCFVLFDAKAIVVMLQTPRQIV